MRPTVDHAVRQIAGYGHAAFAGPLTLAPTDFGTFYGQVRSERLDGLALQMWRDGALELTDQQVNVFTTTHREEMEQVLRLERAAMEVTRLLCGAGIRAVLLKGVALANTVYPDPAWRSFGDVDVLVEPAQFVVALEVLVRAGARRELPEVRPGFDARFAKDVPLLLDGMTIDMHRTLIQGPFGERIPVSTLIERSRSVELGGDTIRVLDPADSYVLAGLTAGAADVPARLITLRDLLELERAASFDAADVRRAAAEWGVAAALARGVQVLGDIMAQVNEPGLLAWARGIHTSRVDRMYMRCYTSTARSYRSTLATLAAIPGWADRAQFARAVVVPQRSYRQARKWSLADHARRGFGKLRR